MSIFRKEDAMEEQWAPSHESPNYEVSSDGRVRNAKSGRVLKTYTNEKGYKTVSISDRGKSKTKKIHRLVAGAFRGELKQTEEVYHKDGNRSNNNIYNLEIGTRSDSVRRSYETKSPYQQKRILVVETGEVYDSIQECSEATGVPASTISKCSNYEFYSNQAGLHFRHVD